MEVKLKPIVPRKISFWIKGKSTMIQNAWSDKGLRQLRLTATERKKMPKKARDPEAEADAAMYKLKDGTPACPMLAIKASLISAAHKDLGIEKTLVKKALFIPSENYEPGLLAELKFESVEIREDIVRIGVQQTDLRYRPEFSGWSVNVIFEVDSELINEQDIVNLVNRAGFSIGIGDWRPEKGGEYGRFEFDTTQGIKELGYEKKPKKS